MHTFIEGAELKVTAEYYLKIAKYMETRRHNRLCIFNVLAIIEFTLLSTRRMRASGRSRITYITPTRDVAGL